MTKQFIKRHHYQIDSAFDQFVNQELLPLTNLDPDMFWCGFTQLLLKHSPSNKQ